MSKILGPEMGYTEILDYYTTEKQKKDIEEGKHWQKTPLRPSAAGECERALAYSLANFWGIEKFEEEVKEPNVVRLLDVGHNIEWHLIGHIKRYLSDNFKVVYEQQTLLFEELVSEKNPERSSWIKGSTDFCLEGMGFKAVCDSKTKKVKWSSYRDSDWEETAEKYNKLPSVTKLGEQSFYVDDVKKFLEEVRDPFLAMNVLQINLYACNDFLVRQGFDHCSLWYYSKNDSRLRELRFRPSQELATYVLDKFKRVFKLTDEGRHHEAKKEFQLGSIKCAFCQFKKACWPEDDALKTFFKSLPAKSWPATTSQLERGAELEEMFAEYLKVCEADAAATVLEEKMCELLVNENVRKVKFSKEYIYEVKYYKSPREGFRLKRSKL